MDIRPSQDSPLDEAQIVYLADKLVAGTRLVSLKQRFDAKLKKYGRDPKASAEIDQRQRAALTIQSKVEQLSGQTMGQLLNKAGIIRRQP
jgi:hypothetical protein